MRIVITGATGYTGTQLALRATELGWETHALVRAESITARLPGKVESWVYDGGIESVSRCLTAVGPDVIIHLAAARPEKQVNVQELISANLLFGTQVLEAMSVVGCCRFINTGSYWEYDAKGHFFPNTLYAATKRAFQDIIAYYCCTCGFCASTLILYDTYGPSDWRPKVVPLLVRALVSGEPVPVTAGEQELYFVYIDDICTAFLHAARELAEWGKGGHYIYSLRSDEPVRIRDVVATLERVSRQVLRMRWGELPHRTGQIFQPVSSIARLPGWKPEVSLEEGLRRVVAAADWSNA